MRLLHVKDRRFKEFFGDDVPLYAILSHTWGADEVSYQDFRRGRRRSGAGYRKIIECCRYAAQDFHLIDARSDLKCLRICKQLEITSEIYVHDWVWVEPIEWVWIDTCCIDKTSSAELSEAINSMYDWYAESSICYALLSDVTAAHDRLQMLIRLPRSKWFQRGWTLQELLAPKDLVLLDKRWTLLGSRSDLLQEIAQATGIAENRLETRAIKTGPRVSVAEILSWAAGRVTTRSEDAAYCLFGLMGIKMSLLYGERQDAFLRLQQEIIRVTNDESVFVQQLGEQNRKGLLAPHPLCFTTKQSTGEYEFGPVVGLQRPPYAITNQGLQLQVPVELAERSDFLFPLNCCHYEEGALKGVYAIPLRHDLTGIWKRCPAHYYPRGAPQDGTVYRLNDCRFHGLFIVPTTWAWSRDDLSTMETKIIYVQIA